MIGRIGLYICALLILAGCQDPIAMAPFQGGGLYNTNKEVESFFEPKLADGTIHIGMDQSAFVAVCGEPAYKERRADGDMNREIWRYGNYGARNYRYGYRLYIFTFENGRLASWRG